MTVQELRGKAKTLGIKNASRMTKAVLEAAIAAAENPATQTDTNPSGWNVVETSVENTPVMPITKWNDPRLMLLPKGERRRARRALQAARRAA